MAGGDRLLGAGEQIEGQLTGRDAGEPELEQLHDHPALGAFGGGKADQAIDVLVGGPGSGQLARAAQPPRRLHHPVAAGQLGVGATVQRGRPLAFERHHLELVGNKPERGGAVQTDRVLEEDQLAAMAAGEGAHYPHVRRKVAAPVCGGGQVGSQWRAALGRSDPREPRSTMPAMNGLARNRSRPGVGDPRSRRLARDRTGRAGRGRRSPLAVVVHPALPGGPEGGGRARLRRHRVALRGLAGSRASRRR